jgi:hypothetical protein
MSKSDIVDDCVLELRTLARLIETNAPVVWPEQDAALLSAARAALKGKGLPQPRIRAIDTTNS